MPELLSAVAVGFGLLLLFDAAVRRRSAPSGQRLAGLALPLGCAVAGAVVGWVASRWLVVALAGAAAGALVPRGVREHRQARARAVRSEALAEVAAGMRDAVRAGLGIVEALGGLARYGPPELRAELAQVVAEARLHGLASGLTGFAQRLGDPLADLLASVLVLNARLGGHNLAEVLDGLAAAIRAEAATQREVRARQAQHRLSARVVAAAPLVVLLAIRATNPAYLAPYDSAAGQAILVLAGLLVTAGYAAMVAVARPPAGSRLIPTAPATTAASAGA